MNYITPDDAFQLTMLSLVETSVNILVDRAKPKSRRFNQLAAIQEKVTNVDRTYEGKLPDWWVDDSLQFNMQLERMLNRLLARYRAADSRPVIGRDEKGRFVRV